MEINDEHILEEIFLKGSTSISAKKILSAGFAGWVLGRKPPIKIDACSDHMEVIASALLSSRMFLDELNSSSATMHTVMENLRLKNESASEFEKVFGMEWPL